MNVCMDLKFVFAFILLGACAFLMIRWRRSGTPFAGNELVILPGFLPFIVLLPGEAPFCTMRLAVFSSLFGLNILWSGMQKKVKNVEIPLFVYSGAAILLYDILFRIVGVGMPVRMWGYLFFAFLMWGVFCGYAFAVRNNIALVKGSVQSVKLIEVAAVAFSFVILSGVAMALSLLLVDCSWLYDAVLFPFVAMYIAYMFYDRPPCITVKQVNILAVTRKKGYQAGKGTGCGQLLEDDSGGVANEGIVEDSRIIYALMTLFEKEHLYRNVDIKIANVALMIGTNKTYLSRALNTRLSKNFCQFVNYYRVKEACAVFIENPSMEMRDIAEQCGFSSSSNFSIVFKYNTGFSPGDWCRMVKLKLENNETVSLDDYLL